MIRVSILLILGVSALAQKPAPVEDNPVAIARRAAVEFAGTWTGDGFRLRSSQSTGRLEPGKPFVVQVSLFAGNRYRFFAAAPLGGALSVSVHDESGELLPSEIREDGPRAAAGFSPETSKTVIKAPLFASFTPTSKPCHPKNRRPGGRKPPRAQIATGSSNSACSCATRWVHSSTW
jgi:hypothetical protein